MNGIPVFDLPAFNIANLTEYDNPISHFLTQTEMNRKPQYNLTLFKTEWYVPLSQQNKEITTVQFADL